jgi:protocatechuate 3,4-dioxygenase beta subunit
MRDITEANVTDAVIASMSEAESPRAQEVLSALVRHMHAFAREVGLTAEEWEAGINFLYNAGEISTPERNEFILLSDITGMSSLTDLLNRNDKATESSVLGPFYVPNAPFVDIGGDLIRDNNGEHVVVSGTVRDRDGKPVPGAMLDVWQSDANGVYQVEDPDQADDNLRFRMICDDQGYYRFNTVKPSGYQAPTDGPGGVLLALGGRHPWRPAHIHIKLTGEGYHPLITELYVSNDKYIDEDVAFGVRASLTLDFQANESAEDAAELGVKAPFYDVRYDFTLATAG